LQHVITVFARGSPKRKSLEISRTVTRIAANSWRAGKPLASKVGQAFSLPIRAKLGHPARVATNLDFLARTNSLSLEGLAKLSEAVEIKQNRRFCLEAGLSGVKLLLSYKAATP
jgi:hypothetical protein